MKFLVRFLLRHTWAVLVLTTLITIPCVKWTAQLYGNLKPDMEELLPRKSRSILDLEEIRSPLKTVQRLGVVIYSNDTKASKRFVIDLANKLESLPKNEVASIEYRIDKE